MSAAAAARPRLLRRPVSDAQRQASRRNGARSRGPRTPAGKLHSSANARRHGLYAKTHQFTPAESEALHQETQRTIEAFRPADPLALALVRLVALATFQIRRVELFEADFAARRPRDVVGLARLIGSLGRVEHRYGNLLFRCLQRLKRLAMKNDPNKPGNSLK